MSSFRHRPDNRRAVFLKLAGQVEGQLRQGFAKRHDLDGLTQTALADKLGVDTAAVSRRLRGQSNMTMETIADMVWGLGHCIDVVIYDPQDTKTNGHQILPIPDAVPSRESKAFVTYSQDASATVVPMPKAGQWTSKTAVIA